MGWVFIYYWVLCIVFFLFGFLFTPNLQGIEPCEAWVPQHVFGLLDQILPQTEQPMLILITENKASFLGVLLSERFPVAN